MDNIELFKVPDCPKRYQWYQIKKDGVVIAEIPEGKDSEKNAKLVIDALRNK